MMTVGTRSTFYFWSILLAIAAAVFGGLAAFHSVVAHAEPVVAGAWHSADPGTAVTGFGFEAKLAAWSVAAYTIARIVLEVLKFMAPRTPAKWDDDVRDALARILAGAPSPPPDNPPGPLPTVKEMP